MLSPRLQRAQSSTKFIAPWAPTPLHEATFQQLNGAPFHPWTGPCVPRHLMVIAMKCTKVLTDIMLIPRLERTESSTKFIAHWTLTPLN